jgi:hypothetical protein
MKFFCIPPNSHLDMMDNGDWYFALCHHYVQNKQYRRYFLDLRKKKPDAFILLDNGAAEHSLVTQEMLLEATEELQPTEVIAPDVLFNQKQTLKNLDNFIQEMFKRHLLDKTNIFACPQGSTKKEWIECYMQMCLNPFVKTIGLSKIAVPKCWNDATDDKMIAVSRNECVKELYENGLLTKPLHLLGMGEHDEFEYYLKHKLPFIRSSDSCYTVLAAINNILFESGNTTRIPTTNEYFDVTLTKEQQQLAKTNIQYLKQKYKNI